MEEELEYNICQETTDSYYMKNRRWWNNEIFPLLPQWQIRKEDQYNTSNFSVNWLFFKIWTLDAFDFEISFVMTVHWGIGVTAILPYLRLVACIPCPEWLGVKIQQKLWRHPKKKAYEK